MEMSSNLKIVKKNVKEAMDKISSDKSSQTKIKNENC